VSNSNLPKIAFLIFVLAFIFSSYFIFPQVREFVDSKMGRTTQNDESAFGNIDSGPYEPEETKATNAFFDFLTDSEFFPDNSPTTDYWKNWNYETSFFFSDVLAVDSDKRLASLKVTLPQTLGQLDNVPLLCENENTASYWEGNLILQDSNIDIFSKIEVGDYFFGHCLDKACGSIGGFCILVERNIGDEE